MIGLLTRTKADELSVFDNLLKDDKFWSDYESTLEDALTPELLALFMAGARAGLKLTGKKKTKAAPAVEEDLTPDDIAALAESAIKKYRFNLIKGLTETTKDGITEAVLRARRDGTGTQGVLDDISQYFDPARAQTIAITETTRLFGMGAQTIYQAQGVNAWTWETAQDGFVDEDCQDLQGQQFDIDEDFEPDHPNCRCWPSPLLDDS